MKRQTPEEIRIDVIEECAVMAETYSTLIPGVTPDQATAISNFFAKHIRGLKNKAEPIGVPTQELAKAAETTLMPTQDVASGCIGVCSTLFDDYCKGCGRAAADVDQWVFLTREEKQTAVASAQDRLKTMQK
jgi:predicted Fe-S protein YdhL (DUF1289 family)